MTIYNKGLNKQKNNTANIVSTVLFLCGGDKGNRTPDLMNANHALYHLSYTPIKLLYYTLIFLICKEEKIKDYFVASYGRNTLCFLHKEESCFSSKCLFFGKGSSNFYENIDIKRIIIL